MALFTAVIFVEIGKAVHIAYNNRLFFHGNEPPLRKAFAEP